MEGRQVVDPVHVWLAVGFLPDAGSYKPMTRDDALRTFFNDYVV